MTTRVTDDQFEVSDSGVRHKPTGWQFIPHTRESVTGYRREGKTGDFQLMELEEAGERLWKQHLDEKRHRPRGAKGAES